MGMTALLAVLLAQGAADAQRTITAVEVRLPAGADPHLLDRVADLVTLRKGQPLGRRAVRGSLDNLFASGRFADVVVRVEDDGPGVSVAFELAPKQLVAAVYFEGQRLFSVQDLQALTRLAVGAEYWPERMAQAATAVRDAYARRGFRAARVAHRGYPTEAGVEVGFDIEEGEPDRITAIALAGEPGLALAEVLRTMGIGLGEVVDLERLATGVDGLRAHLRRERFYRARVELPEVSPDGRVVISLQSGPRYELSFRGHHALPTQALRAVLAYDGAEVLDGAVSARLAKRLERFYRFRGFHDVHVAARELAGEVPNTAILRFEIEEGVPLRITDLRFDGNQAVGDRELRDVLVGVMSGEAPESPIEAHALGDPLSLEGRMGSVSARSLPRPPLETVFDAAAWTQAARAMTSLYRTRGFLSATVQLAEVDLQGASGSVRFAIAEGAQARMKSLRLDGAPAGFTSDAVRALAPGAVFSPDGLEALRLSVGRELGRKGYLFAKVESSFVLLDAGALADAVVTVFPGPRVRTRRVLAVGQVRTRDEVIVQQATMAEGQPLDADSFFTTQNNLIQLGIFRTAEVEMLSPEVAEPLKTVVLRVKERPAFTFDPAAGYFFADGPRLVGDFNAPNLFGRALTANGHVLVNYFGGSVPALTRQVDVSEMPPWERFAGRGNVSLLNRGLLPLNVGLRFDIVGERVFRQSFQFTRYAGGPSLDWSTFFRIPYVDWARPKLTLQLQDELEYSSVSRTRPSLTEQLPLTLIDQARLRFLYGLFALNTIRFAPTLDLRDNALTPHRGLLLQGTFELTGAFYTADERGDATQVRVGFAKVGLLATAYLPASATATLALSARVGRILPLVDGSVTPPVKRFFLGGSNSLRGFNEDQLLAEDQRRRFRDEVRDCLVLAARAGCTSAATTIADGKQVPSQGGESFVLFKAELRFPAFSAFDLGLFAEAGNLWLAAPGTPWPLRTVVGGGLRYGTPIGPLAFDLGVNVAPDTQINEPQFVVHFNIGGF
jgi:outer membrane protein insertion porin family